MQGVEMNLSRLDSSIKSHLSQFLSIADYGALTRTCQTIKKFCTDPLHEINYWKTAYQNSYSSKPLQVTLLHKNPWKIYIQQIEQRLKTETLFSKKFQACLELQCEKMGSIKGKIEKINKTILTTCLRDLAANKGANQDTKMVLAEALLHHGADPLKVTLLHLDDYPLRIALRNADKNMATLFLRYIPDTKENKEIISSLFSAV